MKVVHRTRGKHLIVPMKALDGRDVLSVIVKYSFRADANGIVTALRGDDAIDPHPADVPHGESPATSSLARPSDLCGSKPGTEVLLVGHAHPERQSDSRVDVSLSMGPIRKTLRVHGLRVWQTGSFGGLAPGPALAIAEPVPLRYELAWGGQDLGDAAKPVGEPGNTMGRGIARDAKTLLGKPAAQIEYPDQPVGGRRNVVAGFGPLHRHWEPRAGFRGTYDARWEATRMPLLPEDFDARFWLSAPSDQWTAQPLSGEEPIVLQGATRDGIWRFRLPRARPRFRSVLAGKESEHATHLDTVLVDADSRTVETTFHALVPLPPKLDLLAEVRITDAP